MKKVFIVALLLVGITNFAQNKKDESRPQRANLEKITPQQRSEKRLEKMTKDLSLDVKQQEKLKQLFDEQDVKRATQKAEMRKKREQSKEKMGKQKQEIDERMNAILTPEQAAKWKTNQEKMKENMQQRRIKKQGDAGVK